MQLAAVGSLLAGCLTPVQCSHSPAQSDQPSRCEPLGSDPPPIRSLFVRLVTLCLTAMGATADFIAVLAGSAESKAVGTLLMGIIAMITARLIGGAQWATLAFAAVVIVALSKRFAAGGVNTAKPNMKAKIVVITGAATGE